MMTACPGNSATIGIAISPHRKAVTQLRAVTLSNTLTPYDKPSLITLVRLPAFERSAHGLLTEADHRWLDNTIAENPGAGVIMRGTGGVRKIRIALHGRGKSGGARVIYYYAGKMQRVYLLAVYAKNTQDNLSAAERRQMRQLTAVLEAEP